MTQNKLFNYRYLYQNSFNTGHELIESLLSFH